MDTAKVFVNGRSQAVRLPKEYRFDESDVFIKKINDIRNSFSIGYIPRLEIVNNPGTKKR